MRRFFIYFPNLIIALIKKAKYSYTIDWWEKMGKFYGRYERTLDERNRLQLPSKLFSAPLPSSFFALKGFDGCLAIYPETDFSRLMEKLESHSFLEASERAFVRTVLESVREFEIDAHQRITIPKEMMERYYLSQSVTILGVIDHFEIWDKEAYEKYKSSNGSGSLEELSEKLKERKDG